MIGLLGDRGAFPKPGLNARASHGWARSEWRSLEGVITAAVEMFVRARDPEGLEGCTRLMRAILGKVDGEGEGAAVN